MGPKMRALFGVLRACCVMQPVMHTVASCQLSEVNCISLQPKE
jgi:hypothetical protein